MDPDLLRVALGAVFAPVVAEIADQFLFLGVDGNHRLLFGQRRGHLGVDVAELRVPIGVAVALGGLAVALQTVTRLIEQVGDQSATDLVTLRLQRLRQPAHALAGPPQRRLGITACRRLDQRLEIREQRRILGDRSLAPSSRSPNSLAGLVLRQFLQAPPDRARRNPGRRRHRRDPPITRRERLGRCNQTTAPFIEKRGHCRKPLSDGFDIDHHYNIWYSNLVVNPYLTLSQVDSIIFGRALRTHERLHSARATLLTVGSWVRPALAHPEVSRLEVPLTATVLTTSSKHFGPVALGFPWNVTDEFG